MELDKSKISHLSEGSTLNYGKYTVKRLIGAGGFGCTYEVVNANGRYCVKEFFMPTHCERRPDGKIEITSDEVDIVLHSKKKFMEEAKLLSVIKHPGIVRVVDIFEENGTAYFAMDYIDGMSMHDYVKERGPLSEETALGYIMQIANALDFVHKNNRLHLDVKPENVMLDTWGRAILIDFGASKFFDTSGAGSTNVFQTPGYAPIEQVNGLVKNFGRYTDIYALGATLYYMLSGKVPVNSLLRNDGEPLEVLPPYISPATVGAILKAMAIPRNMRQQTIEEFVAMLPQIQNYSADVEVVVSVDDVQPDDADGYVQVDPNNVNIIPEQMPDPSAFPVGGKRRKSSMTTGEWILTIIAIALGAVFVFLLLMAIAS